MAATLRPHARNSRRHCGLVPVGNSINSGTRKQSAIWLNRQATGWSGSQTADIASA